MASGSQAAGDGGGGRSGGKFVKRRRTAVRKTPYDRPAPLLQPESPNWFDGLVSPAKFVAGGASKLLSSFWNPKSWASHSSSSDSDSDSEGVEDDYEDNENLSDGGVELNQKKGSSSGKSEILYLVEQLLMLESYSREECDRLIEIINSRVVDCTTRDGLDAEPKNPDICNQAIAEARKLITKNMVGSSSKSDLDSIHGSKSLMTPNITKGEGGSLVDVAKSYMQTRPSWLSPISYSDPQIPSPLAADLLKKGTPCSSVGGNSFSSAKRDYLSAGSWNIQDEVRRLRAKATEDMRTTQDDLPIEALSSLPTIEEQNQMAEEQDAASTHSHHDVHPDSDQNLRQSGEVISLGKEEAVDDVNRVEGNCDLKPESTEVPDVSEAIGNANVSPGSSNTNDLSSTRKTNSPSVTRAGTRSKRYSRRGRGRGK